MASPPKLSADILRTILLLLCAIVSSYGQVLNPPYFNLAEGRKISATATCGEGVSEPELYCKLVGATLDLQDNPNINLIQGQVCDYCDQSDPKLTHPAEYAIDGTERWWQSPPLSRSNKYNEVNLTIDLGQEFHVAYVFIKMANSPRPGLWILERSTDNGESYVPWQYFADSPAECINQFGIESLPPIRRDNSVICETKFSKVVPLEGGEIVVSLLNERPSADNFTHSLELQEWTKATNVRLRLLRTKTLLGHLMSIARQDSTVTRRYFYSIKDINIGGQCVCNGHAESCDITDPKDAYKLLCRCQHNTCGSQCELCCPGFVQKKWRRASFENPNQCESCNCYGHSYECIYEEEVDKQHLSIDINGRFEGGGICQNCQHNTEGINCDRCSSGYYRPFGKPFNATDVCQRCECDLRYSTGNCAENTGQCECRIEFLAPYCDKCNLGFYGYPECRPCDCHLNGTHGPVCEVGGGQCPCKSNYMGKNCDQCAEGYFGFPDCFPCDCNSVGAVSPICNITSGQCSCRNNFGSLRCDRCDIGFFNYPSCQYCSCDTQGSLPEVCNNLTGSCLCRQGYSGPRCDQCSPSYFGYPECVGCGCNDHGSVSSSCDSTGRCRCLPSFSGQKCNQCSPGYHKYPDCTACECDHSGSIGISCDLEGDCLCKPNFDGEKCDRCREGFYNYPLCEECNCNPAGVLSTFAGCGSLTGGELCECKERVTGRICNKCRSLYWNLKSNNPLGCEDCECYKPGTMGGMGVCDGASGQCLCKPNVFSRQCKQCKDGTFQLMEDNLFGCRDCGCDIGGSVNNVCDKETGQCSCRPRINGQSCQKPLQTHFFPTLHHVQYEIEDGRTPAGTHVRFGFDEHIFPRFSWRGYAIYSDIQKEVLMDIYVDKPSLYQVLFKFLNFGGENVYGSITFTPDTFTEIQQSSDIVFEATREPKYVRVSGKQGLIASPFVLNPGRWTVSVRVERPLFLDYLVLLPQAYYEATLLQEDVSSPCAIGETTELCQHYAYPSFHEDSVMASGEAGYVPNGDKRTRTQLYNDDTVLEELGVEPMAWLTTSQNSLHVDLRVNKPGKYVLVLVYHTPEGGRTTNLLVDYATTNRMEKGRATLYECNYSFLCRQVITDRHDKVAVFDIESNFASVTLTAEEDISIAIERVVAIPHKVWKTDFILPQLQCVKTQGACIEMRFPRLPVAVKVEFESGFNEDRVSKEKPPLIQDDEVQLIYLDHKDAMVDIQGSVPKTGPYTFVIHYYQPHHPAFEMDVLIQNGQFYEALLPLTHCPSVAGCRAVIAGKETNSTSFQILQNFLLTLKEPNHKSVWVDYVLAIPSDQFEASILKPQKEDKAGQFITQCSQSNFDVSPDVNGFCRESVFSLTSEYNNGAVPCQCDIDGSLSFECAEFGGQCQCKANVIGRSCSQCKTGYFGFPDCKPCFCPSTAICHPVFGQCICPPRVTGEKCDTCLPFTYGLDAIIGCEECNCSPQGVVRGELQCHLESGQCPCKSSIVGRTCDRCQPGYWAFPYCQLCNCDLRGTTEDICDQDNSKCYCKENVHGEFCDQCKPGTFFLEESNPLGCTKCFCFGTTDRCTSGYLYRLQVSEVEGWKGVMVPLDHILQEDGEPVPLTIAGSSLRAVPPSDPTDSSLNFLHMYLVAPESYLGNKVSAYGGNLSYSIVTHVDQDSSPVGIAGPGDIILSGNNLTIMHHHIEQPAANVPLEIRVRVVEREFAHMSGSEVTREQLMMVLVNLEALYVRASYFQPATEVRVSNVLMDTVTEDYVADSPLAVRVEQCQCPPNYQGSSCEACSPGYFRAKTGPYLGYCVPCQCNGHSETCDVHTGKCFGCKHSTQGDHCETCGAGYHGDATQGTPYDCLICACPLPIESNNFADSCEVSPSGHEISCTCQPGYYGPRCEVCAAGYYGQPEVPGSICRLCECSGNIDSNQRGSCDSITGECVHCLNNTFGSACELCAPGFFGDAIARKDCKQCDCERCGTDHCLSESGECRCRPNVVGPRCDECQYAHWGLDSCYGCRSCSCGEASRSEQCDLKTGQCPCQSGVTGLTCDSCDSGFWKYSSEGCISCNCALKYSAGAGCDPVSGQCQCLPGVLGEKCDSCPYRWAFLEKQGCQECGPCVHHLLDDTDLLRIIIDPLRDELSDISGTYFAYRRLEYVNQTVDDLRPEVGNLVFDPTSHNLSPIEADLQYVEQQREHLNRRFNSAVDQAGQESKNAMDAHIEALEVEKMVKKTVRKVKDIITDIQKLAEGLATSSGPNVDRMIFEAERILEEIEGRDFGQEKNNSLYHLEQAQELLAQVKVFLEPAELGQQDFKSVEDRLANMNHLLQDLATHILDSKNETRRTHSVNQDSRKIPIRGILEQIKIYSENASKTLDEAYSLIDQAKRFLSDAQEAFQLLGEVSEELSSGVDKLRSHLNKLSDELKAAEPFVERAKEHAKGLEEQALFLDNLLSDTRSSADAAVKAATAYQSIGDAINAAYQAAEEAGEAAVQAQPMSDGVIEQALDSKNRSTKLLEEAQNLLDKGEEELLRQLALGKSAVAALEHQNSETTTGVDAVDAELSKLIIGSVAAASNMASQNATAADNKAKRARDKIQDILDRLPEEKNRANQVPREYDETKQAIKASHSYVDRISSLMPDITSLMDRLGQKDTVVRTSGKDISDKISELKHKVALARDQANRVKLGVKFQETTSLQLRNPDGLNRAATYTHLSLYFSTSRAEGLLAYVGNPMGTHQKLKRTLTDDYMAVEVRSSRLVLTMDLGSGSEQIINPKYIADGVWHQMIVERTGKTVSLTVRTEEEEDEVAEGFLPGTFSVFNLDQHLSKFYIGGMPDIEPLQREIHNRHFTGCIEGLEFGKTPVGMWNFEDAKRNNDTCEERDKLVTLEASNGLRFDGAGYAILPTGKHNFDHETFVSMQFKTFAAEGLMFLVGKESNFFVVEMREGLLNFKFNLGDSTGSITSINTYNDGQWHSLEAAREDREALLRVDGVLVGETMAEGTNTKLETSENIYIGGHPSPHIYQQTGDITQLHFEGCIKDVQIGAELKDLNNNKEALGVVNGCPKTIARVVSFNNDTASYIAMPIIDIESFAQLTFKFKTANSNGLLFFAANVDQSNYLSISLHNGVLVMMSEPGGEVRTSQDVKYNNQEWHYVTATKSGNQLRLDIDDVDSVESTTGVNPRVVITTPLYFGGVPKSYPIIEDAAASIENFVGCIGDTTINSKFQNFASTQDKEGVSFANCPIADPTDSEVESLFPTKLPFHGTSQRPPSVTSEDFEQVDETEDFELAGTTEPTTTTTEATAEQCILPMEPQLDRSVPPENGHRFGSQHHSHQEYSLSSTVISSLSDRSEFALEFKTTQNDGVLFYVADSKHADLVGLFLVEGKVSYIFNCGTGTAVLTSQDKYNDGRWHHVMFSREGKDGRLKIDGSEVVEGSSTLSANSLNVRTPIFVGGLSEAAAAATRKNLKPVRKITSSFPGCIRSVEVQGERQRPAKKSIFSRPCSDHSEDGTFFSSSGGYISLYDKFKVGGDLAAVFEIKPRSTSGIILAVHGQRDFLVLQLVNGSIVLNVDNGMGVMNTTVVLPSQYYLCDGRWHEIFMAKAGNVLSVNVDSRHVSTHYGTSAVTSADTNGPLYAGGVPDPLNTKGVETTEQFVGCLRIKELKSKVPSLTHVKAYGDVSLTYCSTI